MKTKLLLMFVLIVNISFAQQESLLKNTFFKINVEENHYATEHIYSSPFFEIKEGKKMIATNNSEGKFPQYTKLKNASTTTLKPEDASFMLIKEYIMFVNNIIQKKSVEINKNELVFIDEINYSENDYTYTVPQIIDVLNTYYKVSPNVKVQFGENLEGYLKKINKTELDKTLQNSLNLLVVNF